MEEPELKPADALAQLRTPVFPEESADYAHSRTALLEAEITARRVLTDLAAQRRRLPPGPLVRKDYRFHDEEARALGLIDLFGDHDTLITYFWMYGPERERPCPMCTDTLSGLNGVAENVRQRAAFKVLGRSPVERQRAFARERGWEHLEFIETIGDDYARDTGSLTLDGDEYPSFIVYRRVDGAVRVFYASEMPAEAADPGQDPRGATDLSPLWNVLDHIPEGRGTDWYPKLDYRT